MAARYKNSPKAESRRDVPLDIRKRRILESVIIQIAVFAMIVVLATGCSHESNVQIELDNYMKYAVSTWKFSGAVLVAKGDSVLFRRAYGPADEQTGRRLTPETKFLIGSMTKPFTAIAVHQLLQRGKRQILFIDTFLELLR